MLSFVVSWIDRERELGGSGSHGATVGIREMPAGVVSTTCVPLGPSLPKDDRLILAVGAKACFAISGMSHLDVALYDPFLQSTSSFSTSSSNHLDKR